MNINNFNSDELNLIKESCELGVIDYADNKNFIQAGFKILNEISKSNFSLLINNKQKRIIGSFLANWHNKNENDLVILQTKMLQLNYNGSLLLDLQPQIKKLNTFINLLKIFNNSFYASFFEGTEVNYQK